MNNTLTFSANFFRLPVMFFFTALFFGAVNAATFTVTKTADTNDSNCDADCSLREAVAAANTASTDDVIEFDGAIFGTAQTITLSGNSLSIVFNGTLTINGTGAHLLSVSGNRQSRVFYVEKGAIVTINRLTVRDGNGTGNGIFRGGGIFNAGNLNLFEVIVTTNSIKNSDPNLFVAGAGVYSHGEMNITRSRIEFNTAERDGEVESINGGGVFNIVGDMTIIDSSITNNTAQGNGGGINNNALGSLTIVNSTVSNNSSLLSGTGIGGGIANSSIINAVHTTVVENTAASGIAGVISTAKEAAFYSRNCIIARNFVRSNVRDFRGVFTSQGYNFIENTTGTEIIGDTTGNILERNPNLLPLSNNGGFSKSHALAPTSPAIDQGKSFMINTDQRGQTRPYDNPSIPNSDNGDGTDIGALEMQVSDISPDTVFDFDGDGKTDIGIYRPTTGEWWINRSSSNQTFAAQFGQTSDRIVPADYTGDGRTDIAFWRESSGEWFVLRSEDNSFYAFPFGFAGDIPAPGDFDGDGKTDAAVFRPSSATWFVQRSSDGGVLIQQFGQTGDSPVVADYDGDAKDDIAIFRPSVSEWWILRSTAGLTALQFGSAGDKTVSGDYTGDGKADVAFWRESNGFWYVLRSEDFSFYAFPFGLAGDIPVPGDYDGDGKFDAGVFRPTDTVWYIQKSTGGVLSQQFGVAGDQPIPNAFVRQ